MHAKTGHEHRVGFTLGFAVAWARPEWDQHRIACCQQTVSRKAGRGRTGSTATYSQT